MCTRRTCWNCRKITWAGCGQHVKQVMAGVPREQRCTCTAAELAAAKAARPSFFGRLFGREAAK